jgi:predicted LPLAT superfamily acyltransferase
MVRLQVGNSREIDWLFRRFEGRVGFIWVNDGADIPFAMRDAIAEGHSIAMQCDRADFSSKTRTFDFLGQKQVFPVTIYHLAILFEIPVLMAFGTAEPDGGTRVHALPAFVPEPGQRQANLERAMDHFAASLSLVEELLRKDPYQWFNFEPAQLVEPVDE